jgi:hypothetical protein
METWTDRQVLPDQFTFSLCIVGKYKCDIIKQKARPAYSRVVRIASAILAGHCSKNVPVSCSPLRAVEEQQDNNNNNRILAVHLAARFVMGNT